MSGYQGNLSPWKKYGFVQIASFSETINLVLRNTVLPAIDDLESRTASRFRINKEVG